MNSSNCEVTFIIVLLIYIYFTTVFIMQNVSSSDTFLVDLIIRIRFDV